ncbi:MAG: hypothetical protein NTY47_00505, partial [Candidatus Omnitrophica bacterium]|nr:hypothetical protein [Candidatus Omnitrophota bacterium]
MRGISVLELLIALILMSFIVLGFSSIELFSRYQVTSSDRRAKIQNEAAYVLEHMAKNIMNAIGTSSNPGVYGIFPAGQGQGQGQMANPPGITVRIDSNGNGQIDSSDTIIAYIFSSDGLVKFYPSISN